MARAPRRLPVRPLTSLRLPLPRSPRSGHPDHRLRTPTHQHVDMRDGRVDVRPDVRAWLGCLAAAARRLLRVAEAMFDSAPLAWEYGMGRRVCTTATSLVFIIRNWRLDVTVARKVTRMQSARWTMKEVDIQRRAWQRGLAFHVVDVNPRRGTFDMEVGDETLLDMCCRQGARLTREQQAQLLELIGGLVDAGIAHGDLHARNIMRKGDRLVAIDFGRAALRDFQRGTQPHYEKANTLNGLLYSYEAGLVVNEVLSGVNYLDDALMHWGTPPPTAARVRHLQSKARERRVV